MRLIHLLASGFKLFLNYNCSQCVSRLVWLETRIVAAPATTARAEDYSSPSKSCSTRSTARSVPSGPGPGQAARGTADRKRKNCVHARLIKNRRAFFKQECVRFPETGPFSSETKPTCERNLAASKRYCPRTERLRCAVGLCPKHQIDLTKIRPSQWRRASNACAKGRASARSKMRQC